MKSIEQHFTDWESDAFGYGYGTGEEHVLTSLKTFFASVPVGAAAGERSYNFQVLESTLTPPVAWLLINALCHIDAIEYGTSPRFGWLTDSGEALGKFFAEHTVEQLYELTNPDHDYVHCFPAHCNCDDGDCRPFNPFWPKREYGIPQPAKQD